MFRSMLNRYRTGFLFFLFSLALCLPIACSSQPQTNSVTNQPLIVGVPPWPGFAAQYVATDLNLFKAEGIEVKEVFFPTQSDPNTALLANKVDLALTGVPDLVPLAQRDASIKLLMLFDYSDGSDGIIGRDISQPSDLKGKTVARENLLFEVLLLRRYLEEGGLTEKDIKIVDTSAANAAASFAAKKVDIAVTYDPWMAKAAKQGGGKILFTSKDSNIVPDGLIAKEKVIQTKRAEILAYMKAIDKAVKLVQQKDEKAIAIVAKRLNVTPEEAAQQVGGVKLFGIEDNKNIVFNPQHPRNVFDSLKFAAKTAKDMNLTPTVVDVNKIYDDSLVKSF
ncbi:ABC transporter substrate-binding protein [Trichocoleus sp. FACHB-591]|uniref:ABC transporter substrate-binding protein n=1 Tax=Trichocoleus sp. FACHB-591 TaxID=2692872 RepID=UPI00199B1CED|nr:ABC transporter substrate-binding protein [Trichocoleus sp. FACHB-591]MBD2094809.1 ABC transporter substrate-binding protein [Trichocoleus sp. FACHB-591]